MVVMMMPPTVVVVMPPVVMVMMPPVVMMMAVAVVVAMAYLLDQPSRLRGFARRLGERSRLRGQRHHGKAKQATENVCKFACHVRFPRRRS